MTTGPLKACAFTGCPEKVHRLERYCAAHKKQRYQQQDRDRGSSHQRGYTSKWRRTAKAHLARHPLCEHCKAGKGRVPGKSIITAAEVVDHIIPHKGDMALFWDPNNRQSLCVPCHNHKTATEDGGFGREVTPGGV